MLVVSLFKDLIDPSYLGVYVFDDVDRSLATKMIKKSSGHSIWNSFWDRQKLTDKEVNL